MMTRARKEQEVSDLAERFGKAKAAFLFDFSGLDVDAMTGLRRSLHPLQSEMRVVKNTLALRALAEKAELADEMKTDLKGNNAVVFAYEDASASAKALKDFMKDREGYTIKSGMMEGARLTNQSVEYLATLPSKDVLRAQLLGTLAAPASQFVRVLNEVPSSFARVLAAKQDQG